MHCMFNNCITTLVNLELVSQVKTAILFICWICFGALLLKPTYLWPSMCNCFPAKADQQLYSYNTKHCENSNSYAIHFDSHFCNLILKGCMKQPYPVADAVPNENNGSVYPFGGHGKDTLCSSFSVHTFRS